MKNNRISQSEQKLLNNWVKETDFLQDKTYVSETNKKKIEVTRKPKQIIIKFKNLKTNFEEEFLVEKDGVSYSTTEKKDNELLIFDTGFLVKSAIKNLLIKITYDVGNKRDIISMLQTNGKRPDNCYGKVHRSLRKTTKKGMVWQSQRGYGGRISSIFAFD